MLTEHNKHQKVVPSIHRDNQASPSHDPLPGDNRPSTMSREFAFIYVLHGSTESNKSLALRHVMKGKNVGKTHPQRRRKSQVEEAHTGTAPLSARVQPRKRRQVRPSAKSAGLSTGSGDSSPRSCARSSDDGTIVTPAFCQFCQQHQRHNHVNHNKQLTAWSHHISPVNIGDALVPLALPTELAQESLRTFDRFFNCSMHSMYPVPLCLALETHKHWWVRLFLADETSFHTALALMGTMNDFLMGHDTYHPYHIRDFSSPSSTSQSSTPSTSSSFQNSSAYHLQQAVALVNQRLDNPELALSDSNLVVINTLILQCLVMRKRHEADVHISGLQAMVKMRGGLDAVDDEFLAGKICKTELDYALHYGHPTTFHHDQMSRVFTHLENQGFTFPNILGTSSDPQSTTQWAHAITPALKQILFDTLSIAFLFNSPDGDNPQERRGGGGWKLTPGMLQDFTVSIGLRLIRFHPLGLSYDFNYSTGTTTAISSPDSNSSISSSSYSQEGGGEGSGTANMTATSADGEKKMTPLEAAVHIGLTSFLTTLFVQQSGHRPRFLRYDLVARRLREVIDAVLPDAEGLGCAGDGGAVSFPGDKWSREDKSGRLGPQAAGEGVGFCVSPFTATGARGGATTGSGVGGGVDDGVILWLLLIGSVSVLFEVEHEVWLEERMRLMAERLGVWKWSDVQGCVAGRFPWIMRMADDMGRERWEKAMRGDIACSR